MIVVTNMANPLLWRDKATIARMREGIYTMPLCESVKRTQAMSMHRLTKGAAYMILMDMDMCQGSETSTHTL